MENILGPNDVGRKNIVIGIVLLLISGVWESHHSTSSAIVLTLTSISWKASLDHANFWLHQLLLWTGH
jgi:hypothetical protein